ncbi:MAG TPA: hypothetical protein VGL20_14935 [Candidatus Dormibacteraeota bacterium]
MSFSRRRLRTAVAATTGLLAIAGGAAGASAETAPEPPGSTAPAMTFVAPRVGPITVGLGPTVINGKVMDPGMQVTVPPVSVPVDPSGAVHGAG